MAKSTKVGLSLKSFVQDTNAQIRADSGVQIARIDYRRNVSSSVPRGFSKRIIHMLLTQGIREKSSIILRQSSKLLA